MEKKYIPAPRRYGPGGERLWNGKAVEDFTPEDVRAFLADTDAMLKEGRRSRKQEGKARDKR